LAKFGYKPDRKIQKSLYFWLPEYDQFSQHPRNPGVVQNLTLSATPLRPRLHILSRYLRTEYATLLQAINKWASEIWIELYITVICNNWLSSTGKQEVITNLTTLKPPILLGRSTCT
jgi:hypothetical protein